MDFKHLVLPITFLACVTLPVQSVTASSIQHTRWEKRALRGLDHQQLEYHNEQEREQLKLEMVDSVLNYLRFCKRRGDLKEMHIRSCRTATPGGCKDRIEHFVGYILNAADAYDLNPWLLAAMAYNESRFNPFAEGPTVSSRGILQINPKTKRGKKSPFARNGIKGKRFRAKCKHIPGNCQEEIVFKAADHMASSIRYCGNLSLGLSMYNTGRCKLRKTYVKNTAKAWRALQFNDGQKKVPWCGHVQRKNKND